MYRGGVYIPSTYSHARWSYRRRFRFLLLCPLSMERCYFPLYTAFTFGYDLTVNHTFVSNLTARVSITLDFNAYEFGRTTYLTAHGFDMTAYQTTLVYDRTTYLAAHDGKTYLSVCFCTFLVLVFAFFRVYRFARTP